MCGRIYASAIYDGHRDLLKLPRAPQAPVRIAYESIVTRLS